MFVMVIINVIVCLSRWKNKTRNKVNRQLDMDEDIWKVQKNIEMLRHTIRTFSDDICAEIRLKVSTY